MRRIFGAGAGLALLVGVIGVPTAVFADEGLTAADQDVIGTVETDAVSGPITIGGITYVPGPASGGGSGSVLSPGGGLYPNGVVQSLVFEPASAP